MAVETADLETGKKRFQEPLCRLVYGACLGVCTACRDCAAVLVCVWIYHDAGQERDADGRGGSAVCAVADGGACALVLFQRGAQQRDDSPSRVQLSGEKSGIPDPHHTDGQADRRILYPPIFRGVHAGAVCVLRLHARSVSAAAAVF